MRRPHRPLLAATAGLLATAALLVPAAPALAHPLGELAPTLPTDLTYSATDNVTYLGRFPEHTGTAGGFPSEDGRTFYLTDPRGVHAYATTDPRSPSLLGSLPLFQQQLGAALAQEDPDTNGEVLLVDAATTPVGTAALQVVDVSDPTAMRVLATVPTTDHTWTCVTKGANTCAYAYGRSGGIVDLTVPTRARLLPGSWRKPVGYGDTGNTPYAHDLTEIAPGLVMAAGSSAVLMDTTDPTAPKLLNVLDQSARFPSLGYHSAEWARGGTDRWLVLGTEVAPDGALNTAGSDCAGPESVIETWDASAVRDRLKAYFRAPAGPSREALRASVRAARFTKADSYSVSGRGLFLDGAAPAHVLYCAHWMEQHPDFADSGLLTVSYYDRGTRFLQVGRDGRMTEKGWLVAAEGYSGSSQWVSDDVVYVLDYRRGLEVVALDRAKRATGVRTGALDVIALGSVTLSAATAPVRAPGTVVWVAGGLLAALAVNVGLLRRRRA